MTEPTPHERSIRAAEAAQLLDNRHLKDAFASVAETLEQQALACDPDNKDMAQRIIIAKKLLAGVKTAIERTVIDGEFARHEIEGIEQRSKLVRMFKR
jgi:hypothetical protein